VYLSSPLIILKVIIVKITSLLQCFLWNSSDHLASGGAKVTWDKICLPNEEEGLGVKNLEMWNQATMVKHEWNTHTHTHTHTH